MIRVSINIADDRNTLNMFPICIEFASAKEWKECFRQEENILTLINWAHSYYVQKEALVLYTHIEEDEFIWEFAIRLKNVREYQNHMWLDRDETEALLSAWKREMKIDDILNIKKK